MASGGDDKTIKLRDLSRKADDNLISDLKWVPEEISALPAILWDPDAAIAAHKVGVTSVAFSPDGSLLALGNASKPIRLWSVKD